MGKKKVKEKTPIIDLRAWAYRMHEQLGGIPHIPAYHELFWAGYLDFNVESGPEWARLLAERDAISDVHSILRKEWWEIQKKLTGSFNGYCLKGVKLNEQTS